MGILSKINVALSGQGEFGSESYIRSKMRVRITIWLVIFTVCAISACGNAENSNISANNNEVIKEIILYSPYGGKDRKPLYKLFIPSEYKTIYVDNTKTHVTLKAAYPGMVGFSPEIKHRFYTERGTWGPDRVNIFISLYPEYENPDREFRNRNDAGRFALESLSRNPNFKPVPTPETIKQPEKIRTFQNTGSHRQDSNTYVITQSDGRMSLVSCRLTEVCKSSTTWEGKIAVTYQFLINNFENMVDLDHSVVELLNTFNPTLLTDKE